MVINVNALPYKKCRAAYYFRLEENSCSSGFDINRELRAGQRALWLNFYFALNKPNKALIVVVNDGSAYGYERYLYNLNSISNS